MTASNNSRRVKPKHHDQDKHLSADLETFEALPAKTQKKLLLADEAEKTTGKERVKVDRKIKSSNP